MARLRLPMAKSAIRETRPASMSRATCTGSGPFGCHCEERSDVAISLRLSTCRGTIIATATRLPRCARNEMKKTERPCVPDDGGGPDPYHGVDGFTALKVISEIWHGNNEVGERRPLRFLVGTEPGQSGNRWQGNQLKDEAQRQPSRGSIALGHQRSTPLRQRLGAFLRRKKAHLGAPQAITATARKLARIIYSIIPCCGTARIVDAGAEYYESQYQQRALRAAKRRAAQLGYQLAPMPGGEDRASGVPLAATATAA